MKNPLVSVVLPYRNAAQTVSDCLQSILNQQYGHFEVLAIDDHSTDDSPHIVAQYHQLDRRIRPLLSPATGLVSALNFGLQIARGTLVARMDADDFMRPERLQRQVAALSDNTQLSLVASKVQAFSQHTLRAGFREYIRWQNQCLTTQDIAAEIYLESPFAHPSVMFRTSDIIRLGGYRNGAFPEDYDLWLRMYQAGLGMEKVPEILLDWRDSPTRLSRNDSRYCQEAFDRLRGHYLARDPRLRHTRALAIWGAGRKTRRRCQWLLNQGFGPVAWIDVDPRKIGTCLQGVPIVDPVWLQEQDPRPLVLCYVRNHGARAQIQAFLSQAGYRRGTDYLPVG